MEKARQRPLQGRKAAYLFEYNNKNTHYILYQLGYYSLGKEPASSVLGTQ